MKSIYLLYLSPLILLLHSCAPTYYVPETHHADMLKEKGDMNVYLGLGNASGTKLTETQVAYSPIKGLGLGAHLSSYNFKQDAYHPGNGKGILVGGLVGYDKKISSSVILNLNGIIDYGKFSTQLNSSSGMGDLTSNALRYGIQPVIGFSKRFLEVATSNRFMVLNYKNPSGSLVYNGINQVDYLQQYSRILMSEHAFMIRIGTGSLKWQVMASTTANYTKKDFAQSRILLSTGIIYTKRNAPSKKGK